MAFHFPPDAGSTGFLRTLKFVRFLPESGWRSTVIAPREDAYWARDAAGLAQIPDNARVVRTPYLDVKRHLGIAGRYPGFLAVPDRWVGWLPWALAAGRYHDDLLLSARSYEPTTHAGDVIRAVIGDRGSAGGHGALAGAQVPVGSLTDDEVDEVQRSLFEDFLDALGVDPGALEPVIPGGEAEG